MPRNARLRAYLVAATAAAFLVSVGPATPAAVAATPTSSTAPDASPPVTAADPTTTVAPLPSTVAAPSPAATGHPRTDPGDRGCPDHHASPGHRREGRPGHRDREDEAWPSLGLRCGRPQHLRLLGPRHLQLQDGRDRRIVGSSREVSAFALYARFRALGLASKTSGQPGDLVIWGGGTHVGIYLGNGMAISTLVSGVRIHGIRATDDAVHCVPAYRHRAGDNCRPRTAKPTAVVAKAATVTARRVTTTALRLRSGPSTATRVLSTLAARTKVGVVGVAKDRSGRTWYRVLVGGRLGWLAGWYTRAT